MSGRVRTSPAPEPDALLAHLRAVAEMQREMLARLERIEEAVATR